MEYRVYTKRTDQDDKTHEEIFLSYVDEVISILKRNNISDIEMFFGVSWGDWQSFESTVDDIHMQIKKQEQVTGQSFLDNDVFITIKDLETEIKFCHETDLHIDFNRANPITTEIINSWKAKGIVHHITRINEKIGLEALRYSV